MTRSAHVRRSREPELVPDPQPHRLRQDDLGHQLPFEDRRAAHFHRLLGPEPEADVLRKHLIIPPGRKDVLHRHGLRQWRNLYVSHHGPRVLHSRLSPAEPLSFHNRIVRNQPRRENLIKIAYPTYAGSCPSQILRCVGMASHLDPDARPRGHELRASVHERSYYGLDRAPVTVPAHLLPVRHLALVVVRGDGGRSLIQ
jgi:hypothetical protein